MVSQSQLSSKAICPVPTADLVLIESSLNNNFETGPQRLVRTLWMWRLALFITAIICANYSQAMSLQLRTVQVSSHYTRPILYADSYSVATLGTVVEDLIIARMVPHMLARNLYIY